MNRLTKRYRSNNRVTLEAAQFGIDQTVLDTEINNSEPIAAAVKKLAEYEDAEEKGLLVHLPCKVGDTVWVIYDNYVTSALVLAFYIDGCGGMFDLKIRTNRETATGCEQVINKDYSFVDFGKTVFLTPEAAKQALKERGKNGKKI